MELSKQLAGHLLIVSHKEDGAMLVLAAAAATHSGIQSSEALAVIGAVVIAAFWRFILKIGIALLGIGFLVLVFGGAAAIIHILHV